MNRIINGKLNGEIRWEYKTYSVVRVRVLSVKTGFCTGMFAFGDSMFGAKVSLHWTQKYGWSGIFALDLSLASFEEKRNTQYIRAMILKTIVIIFESLCVSVLLWVCVCSLIFCLQTSHARNALSKENQCLIYEMKGIIYTYFGRP